MGDSKNSLRARAETSINFLRSDTEALRRQSSNNSFLRRDSQRQSAVNEESGGSYCETPKRQKLDDTSSKTLNNSDTEFVPPSPWEWRRVKGETISLKAQLAQQEATIDQLHKARYEIEEVYKKEKRLLEIQAEADKSTIKQLELRIDVGRRSLQDAKSAQVQAERELIQMRSKMEQKVLALVKDNNKLTEELRQQIKQNNKPDRGSCTLPTDYQISQLNDKLGVAHKRIAELEEKLQEARKVQHKYEIQSVELQALKAEYESLVVERGVWEEGKMCMERAAKVTEFEQKLQQAEKIIESLKENVKGKLLLEEQIATMQQRLKRVDDLEKEISQLEYSQGELKAKVAEYESIGISGGPSAFRREITRLQQTEMIFTAEEGQLKSKIEALQKDLDATRQQHEETKKVLGDTKNSYDRLSRFVGRLQKKMLLVTRERDSYRQQLDCYEKEITGYQNSENLNLLSERIPSLERTIEGYRELVTKLEADLDAIDGKNLKEESKKLREEIDRLKGELEHRALKGDFNINSKILHFKMNPATIAYEQAEQKQKALLEEVEKLRATVATGKYSEAPVSSLQAQEIAELQQKHEIKISRLKEAFKASSHEYRQACYQLFGWRVDRTKEGQYKLSSQYAESPDDYLFFIVNEDGVNMIETPFSATLNVFIERHLKVQHSVPMFLNAVQSDLFDQQTVITNSLMM